MTQDDKDKPVRWGWSETISLIPHQEVLTELFALEVYSIGQRQHVSASSALGLQNYTTMLGSLYKGW